MTSILYMSHLSNGLHVQPERRTDVLRRTGSAAAFPKIKDYHRRQFSFFLCVPCLYRIEKKNKRCLVHPDESKQCRKRSAIKGCASFARLDTYHEGDSDEDC